MDQTQREMIAKLLQQRGPDFGPMAPKPGQPLTELPDFGFGPMTPSTRQGIPNDTLSQGPPTTAEAMGRALMDYGPIPAKIAAGVAMQPVTAGEAVGTALHDPSLPNVTNAAVQTGMALMQPAKALAALGAGYGIAGAQDAGLFGGSAQAAGLMPDQEKRKAELQKKIEKGQWKSGPERRAIENELNDLRQVEKDFALRENEAKQKEFARGVEKAEMARDSIRATDTSFKDSNVGKMYEATGGLGPMMMGVAGGAVHRLANGGGKGALDKYVLPALEGSALTFAGLNAPFVYNALNTPSKNPQREALETYSRELPDGHPKKQSAMAEALMMTPGNPTQEMAWKELTDPMGLVRRGVTAVAEGAPAGILGRNLPDAARTTARGAGQLPGTVLEGYQQGMGRAANAGEAAATLRRTAAESQTVAAEAQLAAAEARRRIGGNTGSPASSLDDLVRQSVDDAERSAVAPAVPVPQPATSPNPPTSPASIAQGGNLPTAQNPGQVQLVLPDGMDPAMLNQAIGKYLQQPAPHSGPMQIEMPDILNRALTKYVDEPAKAQRAPPPPGGTLQDGVVIPQGIKPNPAWAEHSRNARDFVDDHIMAGGNMLPARGATKDPRIMTAPSLHAALDSPSFNVKTTQSSLARLRAIMEANGSDLANVSRADLAKLKNLPPEYFAVPAAVGLGAASQQDIDPRELGRLLMMQQQGY